MWYGAAELEQLWDAVVGTYVEVGRLLNAAGKVPIISSSNYFQEYQGGVMIGLGRIVALYYRSSTLYRNP